jgi:tetratricopeptide (TPR) repeat protein
LDALEELLDGGDVTLEEMGVHNHATDLLHGLRSLLTSLGGEGNLASVELLDDSIVAVFQRFVTFSEAVGLSPNELGLDDLELRRLGVVSLAAGRRGFAQSCYSAAAEVAPGVRATQESLASLARDSGDDTALRSALELLLKINPDDEIILREHAALLDRYGDEEAERDIRRLAAMGVDNAVDHSLLSGIRSRAGDDDEALQAIEDALSENSSNPSDWLIKATLLKKNGDFDGALSAIDLALELNRSFGPAWSLRAQILDGIDSQLQNALKAVIHAVALGEPDQVLKSDLLIRSDRIDEAFSSLADALEDNPEAHEIRAHLSWLHQTGGAPEIAQQVLTAAPKSSWEESTTLHIQQGRLGLHHCDARRDGTGEHDALLLAEALASFESALEVDRENGLGWLGRARCLRQMGDLEEASISLQRSRRLLEGEGMVTIEEALLQLDIGRVDEAAILVKQAMGESADSTVVEYVRALVSAQRGQLGEARRSLEAVLEVEPGHVRARLNRCSVSMLLEDMHLALDDANELLSLYPNLDIARLRRCEILMTLGEWSEAELEIRNLLERKPHHSPALTHLGRTLVALERTDEALPYLDEAIRLDQTQAEGWYQRGLFYLEQGTIGAAIDDFDATTKADPEHLDALLHLAAIHHESNNSAGALAAWRRVLDVVPDHRLARIRLEELSTSEIVNQEI